MGDAWIAFARSGKPHTAARPSWPGCDVGHRRTMIVDTQPGVIDDRRGVERRFLSQVPYGQPGT